jgi:hypothetical protein
VIVFNPATVLEDLVKDLNLPTAAVPTDNLLCFLKSGHWSVG